MEFHQRGLCWISCLEHVIQAEDAGPGFKSRLPISALVSHFTHDLHTCIFRTLALVETDARARRRSHCRRRLTTFVDALRSQLPLPSPRQRHVTSHHSLLYDVPDTFGHQDQRLSRHLQPSSRVAPQKSPRRSNLLPATFPLDSLWPLHPPFRIKLSPAPLDYSEAEVWKFYRDL